MQKRDVLVCEDSLCPRKLLDVSGPGLGEVGHYNEWRPSPCKHYCFINERAVVITYRSSKSGEVTFYLLIARLDSLGDCLQAF